MSGIGRPVIGLGSHGNISARELPNGKWRAIAWYRDPRSGARRQVTKTSSSESKATRQLMKTLSGIIVATSNNSIKQTMTVAALAEMDLASFSRRGHATQTSQRYGLTVTNTVVPRIGQLRLHELSTGTVTSLINAVAKTSPSEAKIVRTVLKQMLGMAVDDLAIPQNWAAGTGVVIRDAKRVEPRALSLDELEEVFTLIKSDRDKARMGPKSTKAHNDLLDILLTQLGAAGLRISEAAAIVASDLSTLDGITTLRVRHAVVYQAPMNGERGRYFVQPHTKKRNIRVITLPAFAAALLARRAETASGAGLLFHAADGGPLNLNNIRRTLRAALKGSQFSNWMSTHTMRRTVATMVSIEREFGSEAAMKVLGHRQLATLERSYFDRPELAPDVSELTQRFGELL